MTFRARSGRATRRIALAAAFAIAAGPLLAGPETLQFDRAAALIAGELHRGRSGGDDAIVEFYRGRDFAPIWTAGDGPARERLRVLHGLAAGVAMHGLPADRFDPLTLRDILAGARDPRSRAAAEVAITDFYLALARALSSGVVDPREIDDAMKRTVKVRGSAELLDLITSPHPAVAVRGIAPTSVEYAVLLREKRRLELTAGSADRTGSVLSRTLRPGDAGPDVATLRERLTQAGLLGPHLAATYDAEMERAVRAFQTEAGLDADGIAGADTLAALSVSVEDRLAAVTVAMERERWVGDPRDEGRVIVVNLAEFSAKVFDDGREVFQTRAVVGAVEDGKPTPEFSDEMTHMVVNPSWYVPPGIIRRDYLPKLQANPYALSEYEITDRNGRPANRAAGFRQFTASSFPFSIRQEPGPDNALGRVKFMFPNPWSIYLHDTPARSLFDRDQRAYSSGCVRLADPVGFAHLLLAAQEADPEGAFGSVLATGRERRIDLDRPIPIHLLYRTAFGDAKGRVRYRSDIYGRDGKVRSALERAGVALVPLRLADRDALAGKRDAG